MLTPSSSVAILGFGARAACFAGLLAPRGCALRAWDPRLAGPEASVQRARIEAAGVDAVGDMQGALRGARLVVVDEIPRTVLETMSLQAGQQLLDLASADASGVDAVLVALGLPPGRISWAAACAGEVRASDAAAAPEPPAVPRGELP